MLRVRHRTDGPVLVALSRSGVQHGAVEGARPETLAIVARRFETLLGRLVEDLLAYKCERPLARVAIVVPGRALLRWLRRAIGEALAARSHPPLLGVEVLTLAGLAARVTADLDAPPVSGEVHQLVLGALPAPDWLAAVARFEPLALATFRDLHDAGFEPHHTAAAGELLAADAWWPRGRELLDYFGAWRDAAADEGLFDATDRVREAVRRVTLGADGGLEHLLWYGIYDLTGVMADLARAFCRLLGGRFYFPAWAPGTPPVSVPEQPDQYLREVYDSVLAPVVDRRVDVPDRPRGAPHLSVVDASGEHGELEAVARRVAHWAAQQPGAPPWSKVGIVARELGPYLGIARQVLDRFRIPFVTSRAAPARTWGRVRGLFAVVAIAGEGLRRDHFIDALRFGGPAARAAYEGQLGPLDAALRQFGVIGDPDWDALVAHVAAERPLLLPVKVPASDRRARPARVAQALARHLSRHVCAIRAELGRWPATAMAAEHAAHLKSLRRAIVGPRAADEELLDLVGDRLGPTPVPVSRAAFLAATGRVLEGAELKEPQGDGVYLLDVMSARGLVFDHLYLVGLNRRRWPRTIGEDPLLPDRVRRRLRLDLGLDALPVKERGHAEEALLFRHATESARATLTLVHQRSDEEGKAVVASPFVEELRLRADRVARVPRRRLDALRPWVQARAQAALPPIDLAWWLAIARGPESAPALGRLIPDLSGRVLLDAGMAACREQDALGADPGGWDGIVGPGWDAASAPRPLAPTRVEALLRCPWSSLVQRVLGVEPLAEIRELPIVDPLRVGTIVHAVHERLVAWLAPVDDLADDELLWEDAAELAHRWAAEELGASLALVPTMAPLVRAMLTAPIRQRTDALVSLLRSGAGRRHPRQAEVELTGRLAVEDASGRQVEVALSARADRVDEDLTYGGRSISDIKTGKPPADVRDLLARMSRGRNLQAPFYLWLGGDDVRWAGYEHALDDGTHHRVGLDLAAWAAAEPGMRQVVGTAVALLERGAFPLRKGMHCTFCDVTASCARQHRPATLRLERNLERTPTSGDSSVAAVVHHYQRLMADGAPVGGEGGR